MKCPICGAWAPPDPETGYDAEELCGACQADGYSETLDGQIVREEPALVCAWCGIVLRAGGSPVSHGVCPTCAAQVADEPQACPF